MRCSHKAMCLGESKKRLSIHSERRRARSDAFSSDAFRWPAAWTTSIWSTKSRFAFRFVSCRCCVALFEQGQEGANESESDFNRINLLHVDYFDRMIWKSGDELLCANDERPIESHCDASFIPGSAIFSALVSPSRSAWILNQLQLKSNWYEHNLWCVARSSRRSSEQQEAAKNTGICGVSSKRRPDWRSELSSLQFLCSPLALPTLSTFLQVQL